MRLAVVLAFTAVLWGQNSLADTRKCGFLYGSLGASVRTKNFTQKNYDKAREQWKTELEGLGGKERAEKIFEELKKIRRSHPESLMALMDHLNDMPEGHFSEMVARLEEAGYPVVFKNYRFTQRLHFSFSKGLYWAMRKISASRERRGDGIPFLSLSREKILEVRFPKTPPKTPEEAVERIFALSQVLTFHNLAIVARKAPLQSHPLPRGEYSFPAEALRAMHDGEVHIYSVLKTLENVFPDVGPKVPKKDRVWKWKNTQLVLNALITPLYPWYRPDKKSRANQESYARFLEDLEKGQGGKPLSQEGFPKMSEFARSKYQSRFQLKWFADRYVTAMKGALVVSVGWTAFKMAWGLYDHEFEELDVPVPVGPVNEDGEPNLETIRNLLQYYTQQINYLEAEKTLADPGDQERIQIEIDYYRAEKKRLEERLRNFVP